jgi:hypothetical protein
VLDGVDTSKAAKRSTIAPRHGQTVDAIEEMIDAVRSRSTYPVHAAVGLSVSDILLYRCQPVIVEGPSDQIYRSAIKNYLIRKGRIKPGRELVFVPSGGVKGVAPITSIINRYLPRPANAEEKFDELAQGGSPIVPQVEAYAKATG